MLQSLCSGFLSGDLLAAGEMSQPSQGLPRPGPGGCTPRGCGEGVGLVLRGFMQLLPFLVATVERPFTDPAGELGADWPQLPLLIPTAPAGEWAVTSGLCCDNKLAPVAPPTPLPASCLHRECFG